MLSNLFFSSRLFVLVIVSKIKHLKVISFIFLVFCSQVYACEQLDNSGIPTLVFPPKFDSKFPEKDYVFQLLELILEKSSDKYGPCKAQLLDHKLPLKRLEMYLQTAHLIHTAAFTVSPKRNKNLLPVKIPISKGLMGYRLLMIHKDDIKKFQHIEKLSDLAQYVAGQGIGWSDVSILEKNNLPVITTGSIKTLIDMLAYHRFDYFPRGALQITTEIKAYQDKPVIVEPSIVLRYPSITALYVNSANTELVKRLEYGLKKAYDDGSFDKFFNSHPSSITAIQNLNLEERKVLDMCNPILPSWAPLNVSMYWLEKWPEKVLTNSCSKDNS